MSTDDSKVAIDRDALADDVLARLEPGTVIDDKVLLSRRQLLAIAGSGLGAGALGALGVKDATAQSAVGQLGTSTDRLDVYGATVDATAVNTEDSATDPSSSGEIRRNGTDLKAYSGGAVRNLSNIGSSQSEPSLSHIATLSDTALGAPHDIEIREGLGLTAGKDGNVCAVSLYPRKSPTVSASDTSTTTNAQTVAWYPASHPDYTALVGDDTTLYSAITTGRVVGLGADQTAIAAGKINGSAWFIGDSDYLFTAQKDGAIEAFDVADFDAKSSVNSITGNLASPHDIAVFGTRVIACNQTDGSTPKLESYNVLSSTAESVAGTWSTDGSFSDTQLNGANRVENINNRYLLVANNFSNLLATVDIPDVADGSTWSVASTYDAGASNGPSGLKLVGDYAIAAYGDRVAIADVSDPTSIREVDVHTFGSSISGHDMAVDGRYCYVTGQATDTIEVFDLGVDIAEADTAKDLDSGAA